MLGAAIHHFCHQPVRKIQLRTMPRGSWKWQDAYRIQIVECPRDEQPDLRRRGHRLISVVAKKIGGKRRIADTLAYAQSII